ncbi:hypothetical protein C0J52_12495 [Blattella germanica]|nr:hypothetical protein C0J52_12495 [Blattella germanica]
MKLKASKHKKVDSKFDVKAVRELLVEENKFISQLWEKLKLPVPANNDSDFLKDNPDGNSNQLQNKNKEEFLAAHNKGTSRAKSLEELHQKLQALKGKKLDYKEKLLKKGLKNRMIKKKKKDERKFKKSLIKTGQNYVMQNDAKPKSQKPVYNSEGKMVFSKFDFSESGAKTKVLSKKEKEERDPQKILKKIEKQKSKLKDLEREGELEKATHIREKIAWNKALDKAEGIKVKDNPELLKKTIKKEVKRKQRSKKKWDARNEGVKQRIDDRQKKRTENIQARKKQVKLNKMKKAAKKGRIIPGF